MTLDFLVVGGGSAGCVLANRLSADPSTQVLVLEAGRPDSWWDLYIHMPAALAFPIGNRFYDWKYESEPEPFMHDRRIYHARGKVLGGSSSINGMIFQRGNALDYERWAGDEGMARLGLRALPAVLQAAGDLLRRRRRLPRRRRAAAARARACVVAALHRVLQGGAGGRLSAHRRCERLPPGGLREVRPDDSPRPPDQRGARVPGADRRPSESRGSLSDVRQPDRLRGDAGGRGGGRPPRQDRGDPRERGDPVRRARSTRRSCCSSPASATRASSRRSACPSSTTCRASGSICRTTSRCTSSTCAPSRSRCSRR